MTALLGHYLGQQAEPANDLAKFALETQISFDVQFQQTGNGCRDWVVVPTITIMAITFDPLKRDKALAERGLDFADAEMVFEGVTLEMEDTRKDYGEQRIICFGLLAGRMVVIGYTPRGTDRHVFSMRKANEREKARIAPLLDI